MLYTWAFWGAIISNCEQTDSSYWIRTYIYSNRQKNLYSIQTHLQSIDLACILTWLKYTWANQVEAQVKHRPDHQSPCLRMSSATNGHGKFRRLNSSRFQFWAHPFSMLRPPWILKMPLQTAHLVSFVVNPAFVVTARQNVSTSIDSWWE